MSGTNPTANRLIFILSVIGVFVAGYLWFLHATHTDVPCGMSHGCEIVAESKYARFPVGTGFWVAGWGTLGYIAFATLSFLRTLDKPPLPSRVLLSCTALGSVVGTLFSLHLTYIELFIIHAVCKWCVASQILIFLIAAASIAEWFVQCRLNRPEVHP